MKTKLILIASVLSFFGTAYAANLEDGIYEPEGNFCDLKVVNDLANNTLELTTVTSARAVCRGTLVGQGKRAADNEFFIQWKDKETLIDETITLKCTPTPQVPKPCDEIAYDAAGKLVAKVGDTYRPMAKLEIVDGKTMTLLQGGTLERGGVIYKTKFVEAKKKYVWRSAAQSETVLF